MPYKKDCIQFLANSLIIHSVPLIDLIVNNVKVNTELMQINTNKMYAAIFLFVNFGALFSTFK